MKIAGRKIAHRGELKVMIGKALRFAPGTPAEDITRQLESLTWSL